MFSISIKNFLVKEERWGLFPKGRFSNVREGRINFTSFFMMELIIPEIIFSEILLFSCLSCTVTWIVYLNWKEWGCRKPRSRELWRKWWYEIKIDRGEHWWRAVGQPQEVITVMNGSLTELFVKISNNFIVLYLRNSFISLLYTFNFCKICISFVSGAHCLIIMHCP